jgi:hypothetical protein
MTVLQLVDRERGRLRSKLLLSVAAMALAGAAGSMALGVMVLGGSRYIALPRSVPFIFWLLFGALIVGAIARALRLGRESASRDSVAGAIERERHLRDGSLRGLVEVAGHSALAQRASDLMAGTLGRFASGLAPGMQRGARVRAIVGAGAALFGALALIAARGTNPDGWDALTHPVSAWNGTLAAPLGIDAPSAVMRGEKVEIRVSAAARRSVTLHHRATGSAWREGEYRVDADQHARAVLGPVDADIVLVADDGRVTSDTVVIRVTDRPFVGDVAIKATYPAYLSRQAEPLAIGEPATVPRGTILEISGHASVTLASVSLVADSGDSLGLVVDGHRFSGRLAALNDATWKWSARGSNAGISDVPPPLQLIVVQDSAPVARLIFPASDTLVTAARSLDLEVAATDDHGLRSVVLRSWKNLAVAQSRVEQTVTMVENPGAAWSGVQRLDLASRDLKPGDELRVVAVATDASPWAQSGSTRELVIRVPTAGEQRQMARSAADSAVAAASAAASAQRELEQKTGDAARSRELGDAASQNSGAAAGDRKAMSYQTAEQVKSLAGSQQNMEQQIEDLKRAAASMEEQLRQAGALDSGLASRIAEARQLLNQALTTELRQQLQRLEQAAQQLSADETRRSLAELQEQQRRLREQLEKSAEMLRRAAFEGAMQTLSDEAKDLASRERALADSLAARPRQQSQQDARDLGTQSQALKNDMDELARRLAEAGADPGASRTGEAARQVQQAMDALQRLNQSMTQTGRGAGGTDSAAAQQAGAAADAMRRAAEEMTRARSDQIGEWKGEVTREMDRAIQEMQQLARQQEMIEQALRQGSDPASLRGDQSAVQQGVQKVNERLQQAGQKSSLFSQQSQKAASDAQSKVQQATQQMSGSQSSAQMANSMRASTDAMQAAATALARDRERANSARSASGFTEMIEQMQQIAQQQGGLNSQSQGLLQNSATMSQAQRERQAAELAQRQRELARRMEELADASGRSEALANEARRIAAALDAGLLDPATVQRQQQLFRRLLEAGRTLEQGEPDSTGRRESRSATGDLRFLPGNTSASGAPAVRYKEPGWDELRGLTADERRAVLEYFKRINGGG